MMMTQSSHDIGTTLKNCPPKQTMAICPKKISEAINRKPRQPRRWNADCPVAKARALNRFQNCIITKMVKNRLSSMWESG